MYRVAKDMGLTSNAVSDWLSGKNRPSLLARLQQEEAARCAGDDS